MMVIKESRICFMFGEGGEVRDDIRLLDIEGVEQLDEGDALWQGGVDMAKKPSGKKKTDRRLAHQHSHVTLSEGDTHVRTSFCIHNTAQQHSHILRYLPASVKRPAPCLPLTLRLLSPSRPLALCDFPPTLLLLPSPHPTPPLSSYTPPVLY